MLGNYYLLVRFGETVIPITTSTLRELTIVQDYNKFLPEIRLRIDDATGILTHIAPFDKNLSRVYVEFALNSDTTDKNAMTFLVYIREPSGTQSTPAGEYDITGFLDVNKIFTPDYTRGFDGSIKTNLESIATDELKISKTDVSTSVDYEKNLIQPTWTNAQFLNYLKDNLIGQNGDWGYKCFVKVYKQKSTFVFRSVSEMIEDQVVYKFMLYDKPYEDRNPILEYYIYDNYKIYGVFGAMQQKYSYFNFDTGALVDDEEDVQSYMSLSDYFLIDGGDTTDSNEIQSTGRSNDFTSDFKGRVKSNYGNRLVSLAKIWITTKGMPNIAPGQTVQLFFPHGSMGKNLYSYQYSGYWLCERVVHNFGDIFLTKLLLTRQGIDTDKSTSLLKATKTKSK